MSGYTSFASSGGSPQNIDTSYERIGFTSTGTGTSVAAHATLNTKGATYTTLIASTTNSIAGFWLFLQVSSASGARFLVDIATGAASSEVIILPDVPAQPGVAGGGGHVMFIPLNIAAGTRVSARCQSSSSGASITVALLGEVRTANHPPLWSLGERVSSTPAGTPQATFASNTNITGVSTENTSWVEIADPTSRTYGALLATLSVATTNTAGVAPAQAFSFRLATGAEGNEVWFHSTLSSYLATAPTLGRFPGLPIYKSLASGTRLTGEVLLTTPHADNTFCVYVVGFY